MTICLFDMQLYMLMFCDARKENIYTKVVYQINLDSLVPKEHFYRRLDDMLDLQFLYGSTRKYYGSQGQKSLDPVVFFKIC
jgi:transposase